MDLSTLIAVGPFSHPILVSVMIIGKAVCMLLKMVPYSALSADAMMLRMILNTTSIMPLIVGTKFSILLG